MATKTVQIAIDAVYKGAGAFKKAEADVKGLESGASKAGSGLKSAFATMGVAVGAAGAAFGALAMAAKGAWDTFAAGAVLLDARGDFEDLTAAIGTTSDAMLGKLKSATGGLVSDAQLIADASNMMATGLGLSEQQIVAFSGAAAQLDWNLETLTDTLNTGSTRGLKEMGLSIDFVKSRMAELEAQGIATDEAFRMAILEAADKKIEAVGKKSEEAAGQVQILQVQVENVDNAFKEAFSESLVAQMQDIAGATQAMGPGLESAAGGAGALAGSFAAIMATGLLTNPTFLQLMKIGFGIQAENLPTLEVRELAEMTAVYEKNARKANAATREMDAGLDGLTESAVNARSEWDDWGRDFSDVFGTASHAVDKLGGALGGLPVKAHAINDAMGELGDVAKDNFDEAAEAAREAAREAAEAWRESVATTAGYFNDAITGLQDWRTPDLVSPEQDVSFVISGPSGAEIGLLEEYNKLLEGAEQELFDLNAGIGTAGMSQEEFAKRTEAANVEIAHYQGLINGMNIAATEYGQTHQALAFNTDLVNEAVYGMGTAAGASVMQLAELGVATGQFTVEAADAAIKASLFKVAMDSLTQQWVLGTLDTSELLSSRDALITELETSSVAEIELKIKQTENPARELWAWLPAEERTQEVEVKMTPEMAALEAAITTAQGDITAIDGTVTFEPEYAEVTPGATGEIQDAITAIDGTVTFDGDTRLVDADIRRLENTRINVPVYFVAMNSVPTGGGSSSSGGSSSAPGPGNKSTNMVINFNGAVDAPGVTRAIRNSMAQFYADVAREGVSW